MEEPLRKKLDARTLGRLEQGTAQGPFEIFVGLNNPPTPGQQAELRQAGYVLRTLSGTISTGIAADVASLQRIAMLPFVRTIEVSRALYQE